MCERERVKYSLLRVSFFLKKKERERERVRYSFFLKDALREIDF